jgi:hypothetical protein
MGKPMVYFDGRESQNPWPSSFFCFVLFRRVSPSASELSKCSCIGVSFPSCKFPDIYMLFRSTAFTRWALRPPVVASTLMHQATGWFLPIHRKLIVNQHTFSAGITACNKLYILDIHRVRKLKVPVNIHFISPNSRLRRITHRLVSGFDVLWLFSIHSDDWPVSRLLQTFKQTTYSHYAWLMKTTYLGSRLDRKSPCLDHIRMAIANQGRSWVSPYSPSLLSECSDRQDQIEEMMANSIRVTFVDLGRSLTRTTLQPPTLILMHDLVAHGLLGE